MASALVLQCSTNFVMKTHTLGASQFLEFNNWFNYCLNFSYHCDDHTVKPVLSGHPRGML